MRPWMIALLTLASIGCGGSEEASNAPPEMPPTPPPAPARRPPAFPAADQFRVGEGVALRGGVGAPTECSKLYLGGEVVAIVQAFFHAGSGAIARRCESSSWADPTSPTAEELTAVGVQLEGGLASQFVGLGVNVDGALTFTALDFPGRVSDLAFAGRSAAYVATSGGGAEEADVVGVVYDIPSRAALQQFLLGSCRVSNGLTLDAPVWASDGRSLVFHGDAERCSFEEVEAHPE
jgi:hypothetical protein